jgi:hypothetical protein
MARTTTVGALGEVRIVLAVRVPQGVVQTGKLLARFARKNSQFTSLSYTTFYGPCSGGSPERPSSRIGILLSAAQEPAARCRCTPIRSI